MTSFEFEKLLGRFNRHETTPEEDNFILAWYERIGEDEAAELKEEYRVVLEAKLWTRIKSKTDISANNSKNPKSWYWRAAAMFVLAAAGVTFYVFSGKSNSIVTESVVAMVHEQEHFVNGGDKPMNIMLEDGSKITLKPASEIRCAKKFARDKREVYLKGEAFFDVRKDPSRPFLVYSKEVVTRVLGTSFNIKAYQHDKEVNVAVKTGVVSVTSKAKYKSLNGIVLQEVILKPNQEAVYDTDKENLSKKIVETPLIVLAKPTLFTMKYDGASVTNIFKVLEENYGIDIVFDEQQFADCTLTTTFADEGLYDRVKIICKAIGVNYKLADGSIIISGQGCL